MVAHDNDPCVLGGGNGQSLAVWAADGDSRPNHRVGGRLFADQCVGVLLCVVDEAGAEISEIEVEPIRALDFDEPLDGVYDNETGVTPIGQADGCTQRVSRSRREIEAAEDRRSRF